MLICFPRVKGMNSLEVKHFIAFRENAKLGLVLKTMATNKYTTETIMGSLSRDVDGFKNIDFRYCNYYFEITPSRVIWKVCVNIPGRKLVKMIWKFRKKANNILPGAYVLHITSNLINSDMSLSGPGRHRNVHKCKTHM